MTLLLDEITVKDWNNLLGIKKDSFQSAPRFVCILAHGSVSHRTAGGPGCCQSRPPALPLVHGAGGGSPCLGTGGGGGGHCLGDLALVTWANSGASEPGSGQGLDGGAASSPPSPFSRGSFSVSRPSPVARREGSPHRPATQAGSASQPATSACRPPSEDDHRSDSPHRRPLSSPRAPRSRASRKRYPACGSGTDPAVSRDPCAQRRRRTLVAGGDLPVTPACILGDATHAGTVSAACQGRTLGQPRAWRAPFANNAAPAPAKGRTAPRRRVPGPG
ncbi:protein FAM117B-like [Pteropus medius]|uniref:protein FAM117B-like n=1 Tax=Pteropus vampyrus TaxID=132908 RepID=UPI00196B2813|nr:protein FAM117B-like [Pteropus giganteus]